MADGSSTFTLSPRPLTADDAAALEVDIRPEASFQPVYVLESDSTASATVAGTALAANGDHWYIGAATPSPMPGYIFYPIAFQVQFRCTDLAAFDDFFELACASAIRPGFNDVKAWHQEVMIAPNAVYDGTNVRKIQSLDPSWVGYPIRPATPSSAVLAERALGAACVTVKTWDAGVAAAAACSLDARWLAFPRATERSAGFYTRRLFFTPN